MSSMGQFTVDLLTNDEVMAINQDMLGKHAGIIVLVGKRQIWARDLYDGTKAVALFNTSLAGSEITVKWSDMAIKGNQPV